MATNNEYDVFTGLASNLNDAVGNAGDAAGTVVESLTNTAGSEGVVTAALLGGGGYYVYKRRKAAKA